MVSISAVTIENIVDIARSIPWIVREEEDIVGRTLPEEGITAPLVEVGVGVLAHLGKPVTISLSTGRQ